MYQKTHKARTPKSCNGCNKTIEKGTQYYQVGLIPKNKDYHIECLPNVEGIATTEVKDKPVS